MISCQSQDKQNKECGKGLFLVLFPTGFTHPVRLYCHRLSTLHFFQEVIMLNAGDVAPDFLVKDHTGKEVKLSDYHGKTVVLWFYPRASTGG